MDELVITNSVGLPIFSYFEFFGGICVPFDGFQICSICWKALFLTVKNAANLT